MGFKFSNIVLFIALTSMWKESRSDICDWVPLGFKPATLLFGYAINALLMIVDLFLHL